MNRPATILSALVIAACSQSARAEDFAILDVEGDAGQSLVPGGLVNVGDLIELSTGARIVLLSAGGDIIRLRGPLSRRLEPTTKRTWLAQLKLLAELLTHEQKGQSIPMTVRGGARSELPQPWAFDLTSGANKCAVKDGQAMVWLPESNTPRRVSIEVAATGKRHAFDWPVGTPMVPWPAEIPLVDGSTYRVALGRSQVRAFKLAVWPHRPAAGETALMMVQHKCFDQLPPLLNRIIAGNGPS